MYSLEALVPEVLTAARLGTAPGPLRLPSLVVTEVCYLVETCIDPVAELAQRAVCGQRIISLSVVVALGRM